MSNVIEIPHVKHAKEVLDRYILEMADLYVGTCKIFGKEKNSSYSDYIGTTDDGKCSYLLKNDQAENNAFLCMISLEMADLICYRCLGESPIHGESANNNEEPDNVH